MMLGSKHVDARISKTLNLNVVCTRREEPLKVKNEENN